MKLEQVVKTTCPSYHYHGMILHVRRSFRLQLRLLIGRESTSPSLHLGAHYPEAGHTQMVMDFKGGACVKELPEIT